MLTTQSPTCRKPRPHPQPAIRLYRHTASHGAAYGHYEMHAVAWRQSAPAAGMWGNGQLKRASPQNYKAAWPSWRPRHRDTGKFARTSAVTATQPSTNAHTACRSDRVLFIACIFAPCASGDCKRQSYVGRGRRSAVRTIDCRWTASWRRDPDPDLFQPASVAMPVTA